MIERIFRMGMHLPGSTVRLIELNALARGGLGELAGNLPDERDHRLDPIELSRDC